MRVYLHSLCIPTPPEKPEQPKKLRGGGRETGQQGESEPGWGFSFPSSLFVSQSWEHDVPRSLHMGRQLSRPWHVRPAFDLGFFMLSIPVSQHRHTTYHTRRHVCTCIHSTCSTATCRQSRTVTRLLPLLLTQSRRSQGLPFSEVFPPREVYATGG